MVVMINNQKREFIVLAVTGPPLMIDQDKHDAFLSIKTESLIYRCNEGAS